MRHSPPYLLTDPAEVKRVIRENPWVTFVSHTANGLVASHYPALLDEDADGIVLITHFGKPDDELHELGSGEMLAIVQGPHGYVSSSLYGSEGFIPTWNHVTAHLWGTPELLSDEENFAMLSRLTEHFEQHYPHGRSLAEDETHARTVARGTIGVRIPVTRFDARVKLSQTKSAGVVEAITEHFDATQPRLAAEMRRIQPES